MAEAWAGGIAGLDSHGGTRTVRTLLRPQALDRAQLRPTGLRLLDLRPSRLLLSVAIVAVVAEAAWVGLGLHLGWGPTMPVPLSAAVAPVVALLWVRQLAGIRAEAHTDVWVPVAVLAGVAGLVLVVAISSSGWAFTVELALASAAEEVVYRVALPVVLVALARRWLPSQAATWTALGGSCLVFSLLPGHLGQLVGAGPAVVMTFVGTSLLWAVVLWTTGSLGLVVTVHALVNLAVLPVEAGVVGPAWRAGIMILLLLCLAWAVRCWQGAPAGAVHPRTPDIGHAQPS